MTPRTCRREPKSVIGAPTAARNWHDTLAKLIYAWNLPADGGPIASRHTGAELTYYGGTVIEVGLAAIMMGQWHVVSGRGLARTRRRSQSAFGVGFWPGPDSQDRMALGINFRIRAGRPVGLGPPAAGIVAGPPSAATGASG